MEGVSVMTTTEATLPTTSVRRFPIRGVVWGLMFGIGLTLVLVVTKAVSLDVMTLIIVTAAGTVAGVLWSLFGPARKADGSPPSPRAPFDVPETSRFDEFGDGTPTGTATPERSDPGHF